MKGSDVVEHAFRRTADGPVVTLTVASADTGRLGSTEELIAGLKVARRAEASCLVLGSHDGVFCRGAPLSVDEGRSVSEGRVAGMWARQHLVPLLQLLHEFPAPVVAAVEGPAYGLGLSLALLADVRIGGQSARFSTADPEAGGVAVGLPWLLAHRVPASAGYMLMAGAVFEAGEALRLGLLSEVVSGDVAERAGALVETLVAAGPSVRTTLTSLRHVRSLPLEEALLYDSYAAEGAVSARQAADSR